MIFKWKELITLVKVVEEGFEAMVDLDSEVLKLDV